MDAKKENFAFEFCKRCERYNSLEEKYKKYNKYRNCPITKKLKAITDRNTEIQKKIADYFNITVKQLYRYTSGEANTYKKLNEMYDFKRTNFNLFINCAIGEIECPHMRKPKMDLFQFEGADLTQFKSALFDNKNIDESAMNFINTVYNNAIKFSDDRIQNGFLVKAMIEKQVKVAKEKLLEDMNEFLEEYEKFIISCHCNKTFDNEDIFKRYHYFFDS